MKIKKNGRVISLSESDLQKIVKRTLNENFKAITTIDKLRDGQQGTVNVRDNGRVTIDFSSGKGEGGVYIEFNNGEYRKVDRPNETKDL